MTVRLAVSAVALALTLASPAAAQVKISQVYGGGGNSGATYTHDFVELYNTGNSAVPLTGLSLQYASATGNVSGKVDLSGSIAGGRYFLVQLASQSATGAPLPFTPDLTPASPFNLSGTAGKVGLFTTTSQQACGAAGTRCTTIVPAVTVDYVGYGPTATDFEGSGPAPATTSAAQSLFRGNGGCADTANNAADIMPAAVAPRNSQAPQGPCGGGPVADQPPTATCAAKLILESGTSGSVSVSATDPDDQVVAFSLVNAPTGVTIGNVVPAAADGGTATATVTAGATTPAGSYAVQVRASNDDAPDPQVATCTQEIDVTGAVLIGSIQGAGIGSSPVTGQTRTIQGRLTGIDNEQGTSSFPENERGLFLQDAGDGDAATSDGIFVGDVRTPGINLTTIPLGTIVRATGVVRESFGFTILDAETGSVSLQPGAPQLPAPVTLDPAAADVQSGGTPNPPGGGAKSYYESLEGMRVRVATGIANSGGTNKFDELFVTLGTTKDRITRSDPRPKSLIGTDDDGGEDNPVNPNDDATDSPTIVKGDLFAKVDNLVGPMNYAFSTYRVMPQTGTLPTITADPAVPFPNVRPPAAAGATRVASFNLLDFFPTGGRPFPADPGGGPTITQAQFESKRDRLADAIGRLMGRPDVVGIQEVADQPTLSALATKLGGYTAYSVEGNDNRSIDVGLLVKDGVRATSVRQLGKDAAGPTVNGTQVDCSDAAGAPGLFDRPPLAADIEVGELRYTIFVNHFASKRGGAETMEDEQCRQAQASFVNARVKEIETAGGFGDEAIVVGDLNAFEDEPEITMNLVQGTSLDNLIDDIPVDDRYSFQFDRGLQVLDHIVVTDALKPRVTDVRELHFDTNYFDRGGTDGHGVSDHDPVLADFTLPPDAPVLASCGPELTTPAGTAASREVTATDADDAVLDVVLVTPPAGVSRTAFTAATADGGVARATVSVAATTPAGTYPVLVRATSGETPALQTGECTLTVRVVAAPTPTPTPSPEPYYVIPTPTPTPTAMPTVTPIPTPTVRRSAKLTAKVRPKRDRRRPFRFTTTGRLSFSSAVSRAKGCKGSVTVRFKAGTKTISSRRTQIKSTCRYSSRVTFKNKRRFNQRRNLRVQVRFAGNAVLKPDSAKTVTVRVG